MRNKKKKEEVKLTARWHWNDDAPEVTKEAMNLFIEAIYPDVMKEILRLRAEGKLPKKKTPIPQNQPKENDVSAI